MQKVSYIFSYICCLLRQRLSKIFIFRKKFRRGPNYCSDFSKSDSGFHSPATHEDNTLPSSLTIYVIDYQRS